ncbi:substrate-binding protein [Candidatus Poriferisodalis sp.]|uniref:substrate-binding protein n=1 Tax=Candidatus Poriferisodalis sp. TaxID=3101277 RepID=UPI003B021978
MGQLVLNNQTHLAVAPGEAFLRFGTGNPAYGWLFGAETADVRVGSLVRLAIPLAGLAGLEGTARISSVTPYRRIDLVHESPWLGHVACLFAPGRSGGTRVTVRVTLDDAEIERLSAELGLVSHRPANGAIAVGLLLSLSGAAGILGRSTSNCAHLAVEEINAQGGVLGRPVCLVIADDATDAAVGRIAMSRLLRTEDLSVVVGMHSSATFAAAAPLAVAAGIPYLYPSTSEPQRGHPLLVRFGETPLDQLHVALPRLADETGGRRWYLTGNDYSWPRAIGDAARAVVARMGGTVAGESYLPIGSDCFEPVLEAIQRSGADHVISSFIGQDHVRFERAFAGCGLRSTTRTFAPLLDDAVVEHLGEDASGIWNVLGYFQGLDTARNRQFLDRYVQRFGVCSAPVSAAAEGVYEAVHSWALACRRGRGADATAVLDGLRRVRFDGPRMRRPTGEASLLLGEAGRDGVRVLTDVPAAAGNC